MIKRDLYMKKIRPFMDKDVVKVLTGVRRCGKSVMLQLIREEMMENGVGKEQMLQINFETMAVDYVKDVHRDIRERVICFWMKYRSCQDGRR